MQTGSEDISDDMLKLIRGGAGLSLCFDHSSAIVQKPAFIKTETPLTFEFLIQSCDLCGGVLMAYTRSSTFYVTNEGSLKLVLNNTEYDTELQLEDNQWNMLSITFHNVTYQIEVYLFDRTGTAERRLFKLDMNPFKANGDLAFGAWIPPTDSSQFEPSYGKSFTGCIDDIRIWTKYTDNIEVQKHWREYFNKLVKCLF